MAVTWWSRLLVTLLLAAGFTPSCLAQVQSSSVPPPPADVVAAKAYSTLERYCAGCHQTGAAPGDIEGGVGNILALSEIARDTRLVKPGLPDASLIYNVALTQERHLDAFNDPATLLPSALEVQALRDWISELPASAACTPAQLDPSALNSAINTALTQLPPEQARQSRFVSLAHLSSGCPTLAEMQRYNAELESGVLLGRRAEAKADGAFQPIDPQRLTWRVTLRDLGWSAADWDAITSSNGLASLPAWGIAADAAKEIGSRRMVVPADWLAYVLYVSGRNSDKPRPALADNWLRGGTINRLAAEMWLPPATVAQRLEAAPAPLLVTARRVVAGEAISRPELDKLIAFLDGGTPRPGDLSGQLQIGLWSDKRTYKAGDTATFFVGVNKDCFLTLVNVDRSGRATVLFPNELQPDNQAVAGQTIQVPGAGAAYRFRFKEPGREQIVAICSQTHRAPEGIAHDFERLRFTVLGDWQLFLREPPEMKEARRDDAATDTPRPQQRRRRPRRTAAPRLRCL